MWHLANSFDIPLLFLGNCGAAGLRNIIHVIKRSTMFQALACSAVAIGSVPNIIGVGNSRARAGGGAGAAGRVFCKRGRAISWRVLRIRTALIAAHDRIDGRAGLVKLVGAVRLALHRPSCDNGGFLRFIAAARRCVGRAMLEGVRKIAENCHLFDDVVSLTGLAQRVGCGICHLADIDRGGMADRPVNPPAPRARFFTPVASASSQIEEYFSALRLSETCLMAMSSKGGEPKSQLMGSGVSKIKTLNYITRKAALSHNKLRIWIGAISFFQAGTWADKQSMLGEC